MEDKYLTVTALSKYLKYKFDSDDNLKKVFIKGEISNFKSHSSGHYYFSLKDKNSIIRAIMFRGNTSKLAFEPKEGMEVLATGTVSVYEAGGNYQLYVSDMIEEGVGNLYVAFEKLKEKLSKEGLFDQGYKKKLSKYPKRVGIVTASTGAAIRDVLTTIKRRYPICETYLFPCLVQGENAPDDIVKKIKQADEYDLDVLIVGRGGGSFEDLNCFNDEMVARTIFASKTPIISAVGHEVDFTIADFVADLRAPTPTAAAELAVPNIIDISNMLEQYKIRMTENIYQKINYLNLTLEGIKNSFVIKNPELMLNTKKQTLDLIQEKINRLIYENYERKKQKFDILKKNYILNNPQTILQKSQHKINIYIEKLKMINPLEVLKRGYSVIYKNDVMIKNINSLSVNDYISVRLSDGIIDAEIKKKKEN